MADLTLVSRRLAVLRLTESDYKMAGIPAVEGWLVAPRSTVSWSDRGLACLPYAIPAIQALPFGWVLVVSLAALVPAFEPFVGILYRLEHSQLGTTIVYGSFGIFLVLFFLVVRNRDISHFVRFNTMQALLVTIALSLFDLFFERILAAILSTLGALQVLALLNSTLFLAVMSISVFAIVQNLRGLYPEVPALSNAAYTQVSF